MSMLGSLNPKHLPHYRDLARLAVKHGGRDLLDRMGLAEMFAGDEAPADIAKRNAEELASDLEELGPTFVKLGQVLSSRTELLPSAYIEALSRLHDSVGPFPTEKAKAIIAEQLGRPVEELYASFDDQPIAAASLGQVHGAMLQDGTRVVVKVQRPDVEQIMADDLDAIENVAAFLDDYTDLGRQYRFRAIVGQLRRSLLRELDYEREAANLTLMADRHERFEKLMVPRPIEGLCAGRVLTMQRIEGVSLSSKHGQSIDAGDELLKQLFHAYLRQILVDGLFHADPHPGNVMLTDDGRLGLIDMGMTGFVDPTMREDLLRLLLAVSEGRA